ncbi:uncharacterized protein LOC135826823 [Sycon ciliatum]|uniref:uncharacterized protein LOC135826823 n=1 Tax=Sycon ciliatum TaxID=27933 RepID=UPI0031F6FD3E
MAAVIAVELATSVTSALQLSMDKVVFWSDSMDVIHWIRSASRKFKPFVAHRIGLIQTATLPQQWRHVPTASNPADLASRGATVSALVKSSLWWEGPPFLHSDSADWPALLAGPPTAPSAEEFKQSSAAEAVSFVTVAQPPGFRLKPERYSDWLRLVRVTAWVMRFIGNSAGRTRITSELTAAEISDAEQLWIAQAQSEAFSDELKSVRNKQAVPARSALLKLNPKVDADGLLRCDGRTQYAEWLPHNMRFPVILPRNHHVTQLIVKHHHELQQHGCTNQTLSSLSTTFWVVSAREAIQEWVPALNRRTKWPHAQKSLQPDDAVLVLQSDTPLGPWPLGRVVKVFPGADGKVRVAEVVVCGKRYARPIT